MYLRYGIIADTIAPAAGSKKNILGTFDVIFTKQVPALHRRLGLIVRIEGHPTEKGPHQLRVEFVDAYAQIFLPPAAELFVNVRGADGRPLPAGKLTVAAAWVFLAVAAFDYRHLAGLAAPLYAVGLLALVLLLGAGLATGPGCGWSGRTRTSSR